MLEMLKARKEALQKQGTKGFTLMEMLIVIAIIAVLVAIAIPVMTQQLENSREATDKANLRSAYAEVVTAYLNDNATHTVTVPVNQKQEKWQSETNEPTSIKIGADLALDTNAAQGGADATAKTSGDYSVTIATDGTVTIS